MKSYLLAVNILILPLTVYSLSVDVKNATPINIYGLNYYYLQNGKTAEIYVTGGCELEIEFIKLIKETDLMMRGIYFITVTIDSKAKKTYQFPFESSERELKTKTTTYILSEPKSISFTLEEGEHRILIEAQKGTEWGIIFSLRARERKIKLEPVKEEEKVYDLREKLFLTGGFGGYMFGIGGSYISNPSGGIEVGVCPFKGIFCTNLMFDFVTKNKDDERNSYIAKQRIDLYRILFGLSYREFLGDYFVFEVFACGGFYPVTFKYSYEPPLAEGESKVLTAWGTGGGVLFGFVLGPGELNLRFLSLTSKIFKDEKIEGDFIGSVSLGMGYRFRW